MLNILTMQEDIDGYFDVNAEVYREAMNNPAMSDYFLKYQVGPQAGQVCAMLLVMIIVISDGCRRSTTNQSPMATSTSGTSREQAYIMSICMHIIWTLQQPGCRGVVDQRRYHIAFQILVF